jgi:hypothetical protein
MIEVVDRDGGLEEDVLDGETADNCYWNCAEICGSSSRLATFQAYEF